MVQSRNRVSLQQMLETRREQLPSSKLHDTAPLAPPESVQQVVHTRCKAEAETLLGAWQELICKYQTA